MQLTAILIKNRDLVCVVPKTSTLVIQRIQHHPSTKNNLEKIAAFGNKIIPVAKGELASGLYGDGRMAEPEQIVQYLVDNFFFDPSANR